jgi:crossover junction endodeoxyribonuclease RuvC
MVKKIRIGIDPGSNGAMSIITINNDSSTSIEVCRFNKHTRHEIAEKVYSMTTTQNLHAVVEKVHSMPGQGVSSTFKFGENFGFIQGVMCAHKVPFDLVTPQTWMKFFSLKRNSKTESKTQWKNRLKGAAQRYYPNEKITNDMADAMLIGLFCERNY